MLQAEGKVTAEHVDDVALDKQSESKHTQYGCSADPDADDEADHAHQRSALLLYSSRKQYWQFDHQAGDVDESGEPEKLWLRLYHPDLYQKCRGSAVCFINRLLLACEMDSRQR